MEPQEWLIKSRYQ